MKNRFVLGILAVLCLQISFQVFLALERADERYSYVKGSTPLAKPLDEAAQAPEIASLSDLETFTETARPRQTAVRHFDRTASRPEFAVARVERRQAVRPMQIAVAAKPTLLKPTDPIKPVRTEVRESDKGSFIARALPVIKKPYDFFKFVGSKFK